MGGIARAALGLLLCVALGAVAAPAGAQSGCTPQKLKAGGAYFATFAKCVSKSLAKGTGVDPLCLAKAQDKLVKGFEKAETKGGCNVADVVQVQDVLDDALPSVLEILDPPPPPCCALGNNVCVLAGSDSDCTGLGGTTGAAGTVCDAFLGTCVAPDAADYGPCCLGVPLPPGAVGECAVGVGITAPCESSVVVTLSEGSCHEERGCVAPGDELTSGCTAAKLKAAGSYASAVARCEAKAVAKGVPADIVCLGKAQSKLQKAFEKAERKDDCEERGEADPARNQVDGDLALLFDILEAPVSVCCDAGPVCLWVPDAAACVDNGGIPGAVGSVCNSVSGDCAPPPAQDGNCCENITYGTLPGLCAAGTSSQVQCENSGGTFVGDAVCLPAQVCIE